MPTTSEGTRCVFVIMPFGSTGTRNESQLTTFFQNNIKIPIESAPLRHRHVVHRSGQTFDITAEIIRDLCRADIVIADLSGADPNPNVMYELGVRLASSDAPVILIREQKKDNRRIFDIFGFYTHDYDPFDYGALEKHLIEKLQRLDAGEETFSNPVLAIVREELARREPDLTTVSPDRQRALALSGIHAVADTLERGFGPYGSSLGVRTPDGGLRLERRGAAMAAAMESANPFEAVGIRAMARCAEEMTLRGGGTKLAVIIARKLIDGCATAAAAGLPFREIEPLLTSFLDQAASEVRALTQVLTPRAVPGIIETAAGAKLELDLAAAFEAAGSNGSVSVEPASAGEPSVIEKVDHPVFDRGVLGDSFIEDRARGETVLEECRILICIERLTAAQQIVPTLELAARLGKPLLLVAADIEGEALATIAVNFVRIRCVPIKLPGVGVQPSGVAHDLAILTGATILDPSRGPGLGRLREEHLGHAERVVVSADRTELFGAGGTKSAIAARVAELGAAAKRVGAPESWRLSERVTRLAGTAVTVRVGGSTIDEVRDKLYRLQSARDAFVSAMLMGIVPGGGAALLHASGKLTAPAAAGSSGRAALDVVKSALEAPLRTLVPASPEPLIAEALRGGPRFGYNVRTKRVEDLVDAGVIDPLDAVVRALAVAYGAARTFLETGAWHVRESET